MTWDELTPDEFEIRAESEADELFWRNCAAAWLDDGVPTKQLFLPTPKDQRKLSSARRSLISAELHLAEYLLLGNSSVGVWAVSVEEVIDVGLRAIDDSATGESPLTGHCYLDYRQCSSGGVVQRTARKLRDRAHARGRIES